VAVPLHREDRRLFSALSAWGRSSFDAIFVHATLEGRTFQRWAMKRGSNMRAR
jgi:hypothetical protein